MRRSLQDVSEQTPSVVLLVLVPRPTTTATAATTAAAATATTTSAAIDLDVDLTSAAVVMPAVSMVMTMSRLDVRRRRILLGWLPNLLVRKMMSLPEVNDLCSNDMVRNDVGVLELVHGFRRCVVIFQPM
jgi:hypothetical protein